MHYHRIVLVVTIFILHLNTLLSYNSNNSEVLYLSPVPNSKYVTKETNIIIGYKNVINLKTISEKNFIITGSNSGEHSFQIIPCYEKNKIILKPDIPFASGEDVRVEIHNGLRTYSGLKLNAFEFTFSISNFTAGKRQQNTVPLSDELLHTYNNINQFTSSVPPVIQDNSLPSDFPEITVLTKDNPNPGYIFLCNFLRFSPGINSPYLMVLDNSGRPLMYKSIGGAPCLDFKVQNNNTFTFFQGFVEKFYSMKPTLQVTDSFYCGNGYSTDTHELILLPDNKAWMMSYDTQTVDMSKIISGGDPSARVVGLVIQEIDENKNVIFQWRSWDHFQITDATHENLLAHIVDYVHGNAIDLDYDGNVLISSRHLDEITKINRQTGNIIWRWGGENNQFTFTNDTIGFSHQHHIRRLENGNYSIFDNGNFHTPPFSRVVEYKLDQVNKTATVMWQYRNTPNTIAFAMGSAQRLSDGNTLIGWGSANPTVTEVKPDGTKTLEITFAPTVVSYRAFKFTWGGAPPQIPSGLTLAQNYPNPFNPLTTIRYAIPENSFVTLKIYDMLGREIRTLVSEEQGAGNYTVEFNAQNISSGVYFYKIVAGKFTVSKKLVLEK